MHLESLIDELGGFGMYQGILAILIAMTKVTMASSMMMMVFAGVDPGWWCETTNQDGVVTLPNNSFKNCEWNDTCIRRFDDSVVTIVTEWDLTCDKKWVSNTIISVQMAGVLLGSVISGYFADRYGRKKVLYFSCLLAMVGNIVSAFSVDWIMFMVLRIILGIAVGMMISVNYLFIAEFVGGRYRSLIASLPSWGVGVVLFAGLSWGIKNWKWIHLTAAALIFPFLFGWFFVPESIRWLATKGRLEEARSVIKEMARYNKKPVPDTEILELIAAEEKAEGDKAKNYSYLDLFKTRSLLKRTILTCYLWFSLSMVYYAISFGVKKLSGDFFVNMMIMALLELPTMAGVLIFTALFGRRWACATLFLLTSGACVAVALSNRLAPPELKGKLENSFALLARFFAITVWHIVQALSSEQYPTVIRNLAYSAQSTTARVGGILAGQVLSLGGKDDLMAPFLVMGVLIFLNGVACLFLDETKHKAMEDTMTMELTVEAKVEDEEVKVINGAFSPHTTQIEAVIEHDEKSCVNHNDEDKNEDEDNNKDEDHNEDIDNNENEDNNVDEDNDGTYRKLHNVEDEKVNEFGCDTSTTSNTDVNDLSDNNSNECSSRLEDQSENVHSQINTGSDKSNV